MKPNRIIIAGSRDFDDWDLLRLKVNYYTFLMEPGSIEIVSGGQKTWLKDERRWVGADYFGEQYAKENGIPVRPFPADWDKYGDAAGPIRNKEMAPYATHLIAFWNGKSKGTKNMIEEATKAGLKVKVVRY